MQLFWASVLALVMSQLPTATILGVVKDSTGAVIPGATITATVSGNSIRTEDRVLNKEVYDEKGSGLLRNQTSGEPSAKSTAPPPNWMEQ